MTHRLRPPVLHEWKRLTVRDPGCVRNLNAWLSSSVTLKLLKLKLIVRLFRKPPSKVFKSEIAAFPGRGRRKKNSKL